MKKLFIFLVLTQFLQAECQDFSRVPLGMSNGFIKNDQITATSQFAADNYAYTARLKLTGIRWCSVLKAPVNYSEYVQVDFKSVVTLTGVATQGDDSYTPNYVKKYYLEVGMDGNQYSDVKGSDGNRQVFTGNTNNNGIVYNWLTAPTKARFVRFRATDASGDHICARLEFYGSKDSRAADRAIYPLGMENGVIEDSQLSHSSQYNGNPSVNGRLNKRDAAWCVRKNDNSEWMQIDFKQPMVITAIATQGHGIASSKDRTYKYYLQYREVGSTTFKYARNSTNGNILFTGNYKFQNLIVMNLLPVPVTTQFLRINPITGGYLSPDKCLRAEVYGYHPECAGDLTLFDSVKLIVSSSTSATFANGSIVHSRYAWCANTAATSEYIKVDLGSIRRITGFGIQGDSENDQWPTRIKIGVSNSSSAPVEMATEYIGTFGRFHVTRHWFKDLIYARYIRFRPTQVNGGSSVCMRIQVLGCLDFSRVPLGMSNGFIKNDQITATSKYATDNYAYTARLKLTGIRWCSVLKAPVNYSEYVQVDFKSVVTLTGIATQGDDNYHLNYVKKYYLEVSMDGNQYSDVKGSDGNRQVFTGNTDHTGIVYAWLTAPARARFVRFRASDVSGAHICVRMEIYGSRGSQAANKVVYPLGMESGVIEDAQLSHSSEVNGNPAQNGRLRKSNAAWCANNGNNNEWMQIDFKQPMVITAIATQGHSGSGSVDRTYKYYLQYREMGATTYLYAKDSANGNVLFTGNYRFQNLIVMNLLPVPVTTQFLRINPITAGLGSATRCLRSEVYGYHPVCSDDLTSLATITASSSSEAGQHAFIYSRTTWCASSSDYLDIDLMMPRMVTGVGIQGDSNNEQWVKTFTLSHGLSKGSMQQTGTTYTANNDRNSIVRHWLLPPLFARFIRISVDTFQTAACMRIQILGCSKDYAILRSINSTVVNMRTAVVSWDVVYNASSTVTLQYRKIENQTWMEIANLDSGSVSVSNLEKYQNYIVRLKSSKGILMLKNYVFGGTFSETSKFKLQIDPRIEPKHGIPAIVTTYTVTIFWQQLTQNEILDWDVIGFNIIYKCIDGPGNTNCNAKEVNISNAEAANFTASNLIAYTNYTFTVSVYNLVAKGPKSMINAKTEMKKIDVAPKVHSIRPKTSNMEIVVKDDSRFIVFGYHIAFRCIATSETRDCASSKWINVTAAKNSTTIYGLVSWTMYKLHITAYNKLGDSPVNISFATTLETAPSVPPTGITVTNVNTTEVAFSWQTLKKNDTNGELVAFAVKLVRLDTSMEIQWNISSSLQNFIASGLKAYANYSISIAAVNRAGVGPYSTSVIIETLQSAPTGSPIISSVQPDRFSIILTITNINKENENGPLIGYKILYRCVKTAITRRCSSTVFNTTIVAGSGKTELNLGSLTSWTRYSVTVNVYNEIGDGPYSTIVNFTTLEEPPSMSPKEVSLDVIGSRSLRMRWENLDWEDRNGIITLFSLKLMNETAVVETQNISSVNSGMNFTELWPYSNYSVIVAAINSAGLGPYSKPVSARTMEEAPGEAPSIANITTHKYSFSLILKNINKRLEFGKMIGYHVIRECVPNGNISHDCPANSTKNETVFGYPSIQLVVSKLTPWTRYRVRLQIFNSAGVSRISEHVEGVTKEDNPSVAPSDITVDVISSKSVFIKWKQLAKQETNGPITSYSITFRYKRRGVPASMSIETSDLSAVVDNLFPYTVYNISIKAKNLAGYGPESGLKSNRTKEDAPSPPYDVRAIPQGSTSMKVTWKEPLDPNGIIRKYTLEHCNRNCTVSTLLGNITETVLYGLEADVYYTFKVVAHTIKVGNWSVTIVQQTLEGIPSEPRTFSIATRESTFLVLNWLEPAYPRGRIVSYQIFGNGVKPYLNTFIRAINTTYSCTPSCQTSFNLSNLVPGTYYNLKIAARTSKGQGPFSSAINGWTKIAAASSPQVITVKDFRNGGTEMNLTVNTVSNLVGPISHYEMIVQIRTGNEGPMTTFLSLKSKADAVAGKVNYYLMAKREPGKMPLFMQIKPGISRIDALGDDLETPGKYFLHFRAVSKRESETVNGRATFVPLERTYLKKLPEPKKDEVKSSTITISLDVALPSGFTPSYYYVIAIKITDSKQVKDPSTYKQEDLKKYQPNMKNTPYIAAILTHKEVIDFKTFKLGDGKVTKSTTKRRRRLARATVEEYSNQPLDPESTYSVFIRVHSTTSTPFSTPWTNPVKTTAKPPEGGTKTDPTVAIGTGAGVAVVILVAAVVGAMLIRRRRRPSYKSSESLDATELKEVPDGRGHLNRVPSVDSRDIEIPLEPANLTVVKSPKYPPFPAKDIVQIFNRRSEGDDTGFNEEFGTLPKEQLFTWQTGEDQRNKPRNRFANIISYDYNRVKLKQSRNKSDYVNASYVVDYFGEKRYIACQAPVPSTVDDFWAMIWEQNIRGIVMLTRCVEGPKKKSEEYWPRSGSAVYDNDGYQIHVTYCGIEEFPDYIFTTLEMKVGNARRKLYHLHFIAWPDYGIPEYPTSLLSFRRRVRKFIPWEKQGSDPIIVHCSAGVGRTGTFLAIDTLIPLIEKSKIIDVYGYVYLLRLQRSQMVQRDAQYKFIYECLLEATVCGITEISVQEFKKKYETLCDVDSRTKKGGIVREFTSLSIVATTIPDEEFSSAKLAANQHKNRDMHVLPRNTQRLFLPSLSSEEGCNYINATFADGNSKDQFVVTQSPLENTVKDFWRMVIERGSPTIVSLTEANEIYPKYYPSVGEAHYDDGKISVQLISFEEIANGVVKSILTAYDQPFNRSLDEVHHYHLSTWIDRSVPSDITSLVSLIEATESTQRRLRGGPIIVHCGNGGGRSGTFVAAYTILERLKSEQMVDVFQTVRRLRKCRSSFVENKEQYKLLYDVVSCYLEQFSAYSNF